jgi:Na+-driven multidrug efflux pump
MRIERISARAFPILLLAGFLAAGSWLRLWNLGAASFWVDEVNSYYSAESWNETGRDLFPSGKVNGRAQLYTAATAAVFRMFGMNETTTRLPAAFFGICSIFFPILSPVLDLVLNALLVPKTGIAGAALAALASMSAGAIWGAFNVLKKFHAMPTVRSALDLGLASAGFLGCILAIRTGGFGFVGIGLLGTAVFGLVLLISGEIRREDMVILSVRTKADGGVPAPPDSI